MSRTCTGWRTANTRWFLGRVFPMRPAASIWWLRVYPPCATWPYGRALASTCLRPFPPEAGAVSRVVVGAVPRSCRRHGHHPTAAQANRSDVIGYDGGHWSRRGPPPRCRHRQKALGRGLRGPIVRFKQAVNLDCRRPSSVNLVSIGAAADGRFRAGYSQGRQLPPFGPDPRVDRDAGRGGRGGPHPRVGRRTAVQQEHVLQLVGLGAMAGVILPVGMYLGLGAAPRSPAAPA